MRVRISRVQRATDQTQRRSCSREVARRQRSISEETDTFYDRLWKDKAVDSILADANLSLETVMQLIELLEPAPFITRILTRMGQSPWDDIKIPGPQWDT